MSVNWIAVINDLKPIELELILELTLDKVNSLPDHKKNSIILRVFSGSHLRMIKKGILNAPPKQTTSQVNVIAAMRDVRTTSK